MGIIIWLLSAYEVQVSVRRNLFLYSDAQKRILIVETPIPKAKRSELGKLNNPAQRRV